MRVFGLLVKAGIPRCGEGGDQGRRGTAQQVHSAKGSGIEGALKLVGRDFISQGTITPDWLKLGRVTIAQAKGYLQERVW